LPPHLTRTEPAPDGASEMSARTAPVPNGAVSEIEARLGELVATSGTTTPRATVGGDEREGDPPRPVEDASKHILLGPALAVPDRFQSRLGKMLIDRGLITKEELERALERQQQTGERLGEALVAIGAAASDDVARVLADHLRMPYVDLGDDITDMTVVGVISAEIARRNCALPFARWGDRIVVAMANPNDTEVVDEIRRLVGAPILVTVADPVALRKMIAAVYGTSETSVDAPGEPHARANFAAPTPASTPEPMGAVAFTCPACGQDLTLRAAPWVMTEVNRDPGRVYIWDREPRDHEPAHVCARR
jgi:Type II secretion system (T2SS), protein E, N-terminal domain